MDDEIVIGVENKKTPTKNKKTSKKTNAKKNNKNKAVKHKKGKVRKQAKIVFGMILFVAVVILLLCSPIFDIRNISVENDEISYTVHCSKGTYIRSLCEDIATKLGTCGTMSYLRRIKTGEFSIENAITIEEIQEDKIYHMEKLFDNKIVIEKDLDKLLNGMELPCDKPDGLYSLYTNCYIGIGKIKDKKLKREIIL